MKRTSCSSLAPPRRQAVPATCRTQVARATTLWPALALFIFPASACAEPRDSLVAPPLQACSPTTDAAPAIRVATYNIRSALSSSLAEIADDLQALQADVIALQEVDRHTRRAGGMDQAAWLAEALQMDHAFAASRREGEGEYGVALLSSLPFADVERLPLDAMLSFEPRVALVASLCSAAGPVRVASVHADVFPWAARAQVHRLLRHLEERNDAPRLLLGDMNASPGSALLRHLERQGWQDVVAPFHDVPTFAAGPFGQRIDHIFSAPRPATRAAAARVHEAASSDHLPVSADLILDPPPAGGA